MKPLRLEDILDLVQYEKKRKDFRAELMALKARRRHTVGPIFTLLFENRRTVWYQVQEMMRAERMVEDAQIQDELDTYNPLVPSGSQWKATLYIEIPDEAKLKETLPKLVGIEQSFYARIGGQVVRAVGEEGRSREDYTSTVHYLTWNLPEDAARRLAAGEALAFGTDHPFTPLEAPAGEDLRRSLMEDLERA